MEEPWLVESGLTQLGWDEAAISAFVAEYNSIQGSGLPPEGIVSRIKQLLGMRRMVVNEVFRDTLDVPLFKFGAPMSNGSKITYQEANTSAKDVTWIAKIFGLGTGDTRSLNIKNSRTFIAKHGECKVVFAPVPMRVEKISVYDGDSLVGSGFRAEVIPPKKSDRIPFTHRGCKSLSLRDCEGVPAGDASEEIIMNLEGDISSTIHEHNSSWSSSLATDISVSLSEAVGISTTVRVTNIRDISIKSELPSGRNYVGKIYPSRLWWSK